MFCFVFMFYYETHNVAELFMVGYENMFDNIKLFREAYGGCLV